MSRARTVNYPENTCRIDGCRRILRPDGTCPIGCERFRRPKQYHPRGEDARQRRRTAKANAPIMSLPEARAGLAAAQAKAAKAGGKMVDEAWKKANPDWYRKAKP